MGELCSSEEKEWEGRGRLAEAAEEERDWDRAEATWRELLFLDPFTRSAHMGLARVLRASGRKEEALAELEVALRIFVEDDYPPVRMHGPAREAREKEDRRERAGLRCERAEILETLGRYEAALREAEAALSLDPESERGREILHRLGGSGARDDGVGRGKAPRETAGPGGGTGGGGARGRGLPGSATTLLRPCSDSDRYPLRPPRS